MIVGCQTSDMFNKFNNGIHCGNNAAILNARSRHISGSSTASLGSLESEIPDLISPLSISWNSDMISSLRVGVPLAQNSAAAIATQLQRISPSSQSVQSDSSSIDANTSTAISHQDQSAQKNIVNPTRYKTEMCRPYAETGYCKYGDKCQFAHGGHQLRAMPRHPKYKTELCRTFHTTGICPYGPRCHFIHSEDESKLGEINQMKAQYAQQQAAQEFASQARLFAANVPFENQLNALLSLGQQPLAAPMLAAMPMANMLIGQSAQAGQGLAPEQFSQMMSMPPPPFVRCDTLGSTGESPPSSVTSSPVNTPQFVWSGCDSTMMFEADTRTEAHLAMSLPATYDPQQPQMYAATMPSFEDQVPSMAPAMNTIPIPGDSRSGFERPTLDLSSLTASMEAISLNNAIGAATPNYEESAIFPELFQDTPPSSPDCGSLSSSGGRSMRLPIFSKLAAGGSISE